MYYFDPFHSPVIASLGLNDLLVAILIRDVVMATPADGPSFSTAPSGTCKCNWWPERKEMEQILDDWQQGILGDKRNVSLKKWQELGKMEKKSTRC